MEVTDEKPRRSTVKILENKSNSSNCFSQWWNQNYSHQKYLSSFLEHPLFHLLIIILVVCECASVITEILLHNIKNQYKCNAPPYIGIYDFGERIHKLDYGIHVCHYISLSILSIFIFELTLKIYALGYHYWNCKENHKLDYFDGFLIVFSFCVEIYFLIIDKESFMAHSAILIVIFRLWHILRIANAVARCFQTREEFKTIRQQRRSSKSSQTLLIPSSIQMILDLMQEKTECLKRDISAEQSLVDRFEEIDQKCQDIFDDHYGNEKKLHEELQKLHLITQKIQNKKQYSIAV